MNNWISVYAEDPPEGEVVLVAWMPIEGMPTTRFKHFYGLASYEEGEYHWSSEKDYDRIRVLAWMKLPDYYEEDGQ